MRVALHSHLRNGQELAYEAAHREVPADLLEALTRAGIHDWTIWRSGSELFHVVEVDDFSEAQRTLADDPADIRWQETMAAYVEGFAENPDGAGRLGLRHVWTLSEQSPADGSSW